MAWNEPGGNGKNQDPNPRDPWGGKQNTTPPDLDKMLSDFIKKLRALFPSKSSGSYRKPTDHKEVGYTLGAIAIALLVLWIFSGLFIVNPAEEAVVLRFGKFVDVYQPGLHWIARFIDVKYLVDAQKIYAFSIQGDFLTKSSEQGDLPNPVALDAVKKPIEASGVDKSKNLVNVEMNVQYRINDPKAYLFNTVNPDDTIQEVASGALSDVVGKMKLDEVLTTGRETLSLGVFERVKKIMASYNPGLAVVAVSLRKVQAPDQIRAAFNDVNRAEQDKATYIQQAQAYASKVVPLAQGAAARISADANGYQQQVVLTAEANVAKFQALVKVYGEAPEVTRERMYLETIQTVLKNTSKVLIDGNSSNNILYLPIDKMMKIPEENKTVSAISDNDTVSSLPLASNVSSTQTPVSTTEVKP